MGWASPPLHVLGLFTWDLNTQWASTSSRGLSVLGIWHVVFHQDA